MHKREGLWSLEKKGTTDYDDVLHRRRAINAHAHPAKCGETLPVPRLMCVGGRGYCRQTACLPACLSAGTAGWRAGLRVAPTRACVCVCVCVRAWHPLSPPSPGRIEPSRGEKLQVRSRARLVLHGLRFSLCVGARCHLAPPLASLVSQPGGFEKGMHLRIEGAWQQRGRVLALPLSPLPRFAFATRRGNLGLSLARSPHALLQLTPTPHPDPLSTRARGALSAIWCRGLNVAAPPTNGFGLSLLFPVLPSRRHIGQSECGACCCAFFSLSPLSESTTRSAAWQSRSAV